MDRTSRPVKSRRRYDSGRRKQEALRTRASVVDAAEQLFLSRGYLGTTIASIANAANVSVETIYKAFSGKPGLVRAIWDRALAGSGPIPAWQRADDMSSLEPDPRNVIRNWGVLTTEVAPRSAPILLLVRTAAATDPEMAALLEETNQARLARMAHNARQLRSRGELRDGVTIEQARDVMYAYSSPELYEILVLRQGWLLERYGRFVAEGMIAALLPEPGTASNSVALR